jgi:hypothetical protein
MEERRAAMKIFRTNLFVVLAMTLLIIVGTVSWTSSAPQITAIGSPTWKPVDFHMFSAETGTFRTGFAEFLTTTLSLLPEPNHRFHPDLGVGPGDPHCPPYDTELAQGVASLGLVEKSVFGVPEFSRGEGVYLVWMNIPAPGTGGRSPDSSCRPPPHIIPNTLFPITVSTTVSRNGQIFDQSSFPVPPLDETLNPPFPNVDGHSHFPFFSAETAEFLPPRTAPVGNYEFNVTMTDQQGQGWSIVAPFTIR